MVAQIGALRFFSQYVLKGRDVREDLPYPKERHRLPIVLSPDEVQRLIPAPRISITPLTVRTFRAMASVTISKVGENWKIENSAPGAAAKCSLARRGLRERREASFHRNESSACRSQT